MKKKTKKIAVKIPTKPYIGQKIYVDSAYHISNGSDDVTGGLATICGVKEGMSGGEKTWFVSFEELPGHGYNYAMLIEDNRQAELKKEFGKRKAYPDPDIDTPWIKEGDYVGGQTINGSKHKDGIYHGPDIW